MVWRSFPPSTLGSKANHYPPARPGSGRLLLDQWRDRWWAPGCVKDSCDVKMELPLSSKNPSVHPRVLPGRIGHMFPQSFLTFFFFFFPYHFSILARSIAVRKLSHIRGQLTTISFRIVVLLLFLTGFAWQLFLSLSFCPLLCITGQLSLVRSGGRCSKCDDSPSTHLVCSCHCLIRGVEKKTKTWEKKLESGAAFFSLGPFFMGATVTVDLGRRGCSQCVDTRVYTVVSRPLLSCVCVCACVWKCLFSL